MSLSTLCLLWTQSPSSTLSCGDMAVCMNACLSGCPPACLSICMDVYMFMTVCIVTHIPVVYVYANVMPVFLINVWGCLFLWIILLPWLRCMACKACQWRPRVCHYILVGRGLCRQSRIRTGHCEVVLSCGFDLAGDWYCCCTIGSHFFQTLEGDISLQ